MPYHPGKANVVADALSRKGQTEALPPSTITQQDQLIAEFSRMRLEVVPAGATTRLFAFEVKPTLLEEILEGQRADEQLQRVKEKTLPEQGGFSVGTDDVVRFRGRICVPDLPELKDKILTEAHCAPYVAHPGGAPRCIGF